MAEPIEKALSMARFLELCENESGDGVRIVIIDSGAGGGLPVQDSVNLTQQSIIDTENHGSIIHSIICHILPEAEIYVVKVPDPLPDNILITALKEAMEFQPHAINLSITSEIPSDGTDPTSTYVNHVSEKSLVAIAAGNGGPRLMSVGSPAVAEKALTVGATDMRGRVWKRSSRGPTLDGRWKPNIVAPTGYTPPGLGSAAVGTSFSTPLATALGAVLVKKLHNPQLAIKVVELTATSIPVSQPPHPALAGLRKAAALRQLLDAWPRLTDPRNHCGMGLINAWDAFQTAEFLTTAFSHQYKQ
ncbi:Serine protease AprX [archaeon HR01]|nr:Serine protease AprX [archaeon HR01]